MGSIELSPSSWWRRFEMDWDDPKRSNAVSWGYLFILLNVYLPNQGQFRAMQAFLRVFAEKAERIIVAGRDFNMVLDPGYDTTLESPC